MKMINVCAVLAGEIPRMGLQLGKQRSKRDRLTKVTQHPSDASDNKEKAPRELISSSVRQ